MLRSSRLLTSFARVAVAAMQLDAEGYLYDPSAKRRKPNFTEPELVTLVDLWAQHKSVLSSPAADIVVRSNKARAWRKITDEMNRHHPFVLRRVCDIRGKWEKLMCEARTCLKVKGLRPCKGQPALSSQRKRPSRILRRIIQLNWPNESGLLSSIETVKTDSHCMISPMSIKSEPETSFMDETMAASYLSPSPAAPASPSTVTILYQRPNQQSSSSTVLLHQNASNYTPQEMTPVIASFAPQQSTTTTFSPQQSTTTTFAPQQSTTTTFAPQESTTTTFAPQQSTTTTFAPQQSTTRSISSQQTTETKLCHPHPTSAPVALQSYPVIQSFPTPSPPVPILISDDELDGEESEAVIRREILILQRTRLRKEIEKLDLEISLLRSRK